MTMVAVLAVVTIVALVAARRLDLDRARPGTAVAVCLAALALRATLSVVVVVGMLVVVPSTTIFDTVTHWCWHTVLPLVRQHLPLNGHVLGDVSLIAPAAIVVMSVVWVAVGIWRGTRAVRALMRRYGVGRGPAGSMIITDSSVMLAAVGVRQPQILVTSGALVAMDDEELFAGIAHERGHIEHRHGLLIPVAYGLAALGRLVPGAGRTREELEFHSERQADEFALRGHAPLCLASAICKAATGSQKLPVPAFALGGGWLERRVATVISRRQSTGHERAAWWLTCCLIALSVTIGASGTAAASADIRDPSPRSMLEHCA